MRLEDMTPEDWQHFNADTHRAIDDLNSAAEHERKPRCGPWTERPDGSFLCEKCGDIDVPGSGPMGF